MASRLFRTPVDPATVAASRERVFGRIEAARDAAEEEHLSARVAELLIR